MHINFLGRAALVLGIAAAGFTAGAPAFASPGSHLPPLPPVVTSCTAQQLTVSSTGTLTVTETSVAPIPVNGEEVAYTGIPAGSAPAQDYTVTDVATAHNVTTFELEGPLPSTALHTEGDVASWTLTTVCKTTDPGPVKPPAPPACNPHGVFPVVKYTPGYGQHHFPSPVSTCVPQGGGHVGPLPGPWGNHNGQNPCKGGHDKNGKNGPGNGKGGNGGKVWTPPFI
jgi:hypothetical protein